MKTLKRFELPDFEDRGIVSGKRIIWEGEGEILWLEPYGPNSLRFRSTRSMRIAEDLNWNLLPPGEDQAIVRIDGKKAVIQNGKITAEVFGDGTVNYYNSEGKSLLQEQWIDEREMTVELRRAREFRTISSEAFETELYFKANPDEHFYGMGQDPNDCFDLKGCTMPIEQKNTKCTIPFLISTLGYGFMWNNPAVGRVELVHNHTLWVARSAKQIDYIMIAGDKPDELMKQFTEITGRAEVLPEWAAGYWHCKHRYETQEELLSTVREYKKRNIPMSVIILDYFHWTQHGEWKFDPVCFPDPKGMVDELDRMGVKFMVSVWPTVDPRSENYQFMKDHNYLIRAERGQPVFWLFFGSLHFIDATNPKAREFIWDRIKKGYYDHGIKMFWMDESEPETRPYHYDNLRYHIGNGLEIANIYPYYFAKMISDGLKQEGETEIVNLIRCAWFGSQKQGIIMWSGDIASTFESLRKQIKAGLNFSFSGIPWWTTDIGGFLRGDPKSEYFRELIVRWFQFGVFSPIFRLHGNRLPGDPNRNPLDPCGINHTGGPNEVWDFGEKAYEIIMDIISLRERIKPYIMKQMEKASKDGTPVMRPLLYDFFGDKKTYPIGDEFMFGPDLLVAPVIEMGARSRMVYLPEGAVWTDVHTGRKYEGGQEIMADAPIHVIPLYLKDDAVLCILK